MATRTPKRPRLSDEQRAELTVRRAAAFFSSLLISPGAGQLALGRRWRGLLWFLLGTATVLPGPLFSIWTFYANLPLRVLSGIDAALLWPPRAKEGAPLAGMPRWAAVVGLWCALMAATFGLKLAAPRFYVGVLTPDARMAPTVAIDEQILVRKSSVAQLGKVVALKRSERGEVMLRRILALGGQRVALRGGHPVIDGKRLGHTPSTESCSYRRAGPQQKSSEQVAPSREQRPCRAARESRGGRNYTVLLPTNPSAELAERRLGPNELWVWGDNRIEDAAPTVVTKESVLGHARAVWWANKPGGLNWERIGQQIR